MSLQNNVAALKQQLEHLFPGKWVSAGQERSKILLTGLPEIDQTPIRGLSRQRISEWVGAPSSGKTSVLRAIIANWCAAGLNVAYIDIETRLSPGDWVFVSSGHCGATPTTAHPTPANLHAVSSVLDADICQSNARFWVVRVNEGNRRNSGLWAADQLLRSDIFDVVILDLGSSDSRQRSQKADRMSARLQRSLSHSKAGLLMLRDNADGESGWGCHTRLNFRWGNEIRCDYGPSGITRIIPTVNCSIWKDGLTQTMELMLESNVPNRLFTHPSVPDRRTPKA